jgi:tetratricopeptide (TPR) repeat protein
MSLLLDALKKAAEQKARQAKAGSDNDGDDRTEEVSATDDTIVTEDSTIEFNERTEFADDDTEIAEDLTQEVTVATGTDEDVTDVYDQDQTHRYGKDPELTEDDTHLLEEQTIVDPEAAEDETTRVDITEHTAVTGAGDDTEFDPVTEYDSSADDDTILDSQDQTQLTEIDQTIVEPDAAEDETTRADITEHNANSDASEDTEYDPVTEYDSSADDETILDSQDQTQQTDVVVESRSSRSDKDVTIRAGFDEDETTPIDSEKDVADFMGDSVDDTMQSAGEPTQSIDEGTDQTGDSLDDMSLLLADEYGNVREADDDTTTGRGPHLDGSASDTEMETLGLVDQWKEAATQTSTITADQNDGVNSGVELESLRHENTIIRPDATSTHTYAPDNYDRTLIRPPSDDASRIFAGMKADDDVLMTPDYAKRVFLSKSSANRMQHYKVYVGIAVSVLLAIGIFSMFELVDEHNRIDSAMLPLKRDPMPGIIRNDNNQEAVNVLDAAVQPDIDLETLKLVENAGAGAITEEAANQETEVSEVVEASAGSAESQSQADSANQDVAEVESSEKPIERVSAPIPDVGTESTSSGSLQISSSSKVSKIDQWLADGYAAYQKGDDATALENYARVLEVDSSNRNALLASAAIKVQNGNTSSAISDYQQLLLANPKDTLAMSSLISIARTAPQESESQLKLMIREEPDSPHLNFVLANVYSAQNRWQEAQGRYFIALQNKPGDPNYAYNLAVSLEHISKHEVAIIYYERAIANMKNGLATFDQDLVDSRIEMLKQL